MILSNDRSHGYVVSFTRNLEYAGDGFPVSLRSRGFIDCDAQGKAG